MVWGLAVSGLAVELNTNMNHLLARAGLEWLDGAGYAPFNEEVLKLLGVLLICTCVIRLVPNPLSHSLFAGLGAYGLSQKQPLRWLIAAIAVHATKNLFPSLSTALDDAIWPLLAGMVIVLAEWVATIWGTIALRKKAAVHPPLSPAPAHA
ncbi:hypothetical protein HMPREF2978_01640 [Corynebacterium sp. HMSC074C01]|nr:hypothetical protein HMPREF2978_01640 [Corynebacterium sp. HMSC074C01]